MRMDRPLMVGQLLGPTDLAAAAAAAAAAVASARLAAAAAFVIDLQNFPKDHHLIPKHVFISDCIKLQNPHQ